MKSKRPKPEVGMIVNEMKISRIEGDYLFLNCLAHNHEHRIKRHSFYGYKGKCFECRKDVLRSLRMRVGEKFGDWRITKLINKMRGGEITDIEFKCEAGHTRLIARRLITCNMIENCPNCDGLIKKKPNSKGYETEEEKRLRLRRETGERKREFAKRKKERESKGIEVKKAKKSVCNKKNRDKKAGGVVNFGRPSKYKPFEMSKGKARDLGACLVRGLKEQ